MGNIGEWGGPAQQGVVATMAKSEWNALLRRGGQHSAPGPWDQGSSIGRSSKRSQTLLFNSNQFSENKTKQILRVWNKTYLWVKPSPCLLTPQWAAFKKSLFKIVIYSYNGVLYSNENEWTLAIKNMDESHRSKPDTNKYSLYSVSIKFNHRPK